MAKVEVVSNKIDTESILSCTTVVAKAEEILYNVRVAVVGIGIIHFGGKPISIRSLSVRSLVRNNKQDLINDRVKEIAYISKSYSDLVKFDTLLRSQGYDGEKLVSETVFCSHAPFMIDQTKVQLELYFKCILASLSKIKDIHFIYNFFELSRKKTKQFNSAPAIKEGYLSRKEGKLFGKWKARYFILNPTSLDYYHFKGGDRKGVIELTDAIVGRQAKDDINTDYRHAFMINELVKPKQSNRHMLCAYNDEERDAWADAIIKVMQSLVSTSNTNDFLKRLAKKPDYSYNS